MRYLPRPTSVECLPPPSPAVSSSFQLCASAHRSRLTSTLTQKKKDEIRFVQPEFKLKSVSGQVGQTRSLVKRLSTL